MLNIMKSVKGRDRMLVDDQGLYLNRKINWRKAFCLIAFLTFFLLQVQVLHAEGSDVERVTWWVAADTHIGHSSEPSLGHHLATAVADVNNLGIADYAVILGDLVEDDYAYSIPFVQLMNQLDINWTYVLGNHDFDTETHEPVLPVHFSSRTVLGIRFIFLSDELTGYRNRDLVMSREQEEWFWEELETHKDKPIFIFSHQPHPEFQRWPQLKEKLDDFNIAAWVSAHKHNWNMNKQTEFGFAQINIHSIGGVRADYLSTFLDLERKGDTVMVTVRYRNHESEEWIEVDGKYEFSFVIDMQ